MEVERKLTAVELAENLDIAVSTIQRYVRQGMPCTRGKTRREGNRFNADECAAWMKTKGVTGDIGRKPSDLSEQYRAEQLRKIAAQANKYEQELLTARLEYQKKIGELIPKADVEAGRIQRIGFVKNGLLALPTALAPHLVGQDAATIEKKISEEVSRLLETFSRA